MLSSNIDNQLLESFSDLENKFDFAPVSLDEEVSIFQLLLNEFFILILKFKHKLRISFANIYINII